jgi:fructose-1,6-bisphosphatase/inositol monophosphatase family enzyme
MLPPEARQAARDAVREVARAEIVPRFRALGRGDTEAKTRADDLVTVADRAAEAALTSRLADILPGAAILGEEAVSADPSAWAALDAERCWVIDPIDGTWNFAHGLATFGVILAYVEDGRTVWGMIHDPLQDDWWEAAAGEGAAAHLRGRARPLRLSPGPDRPEAARAVLHHDLYPPASRVSLSQTLPRFARVASLGASAHEWRLLAEGAVDLCLSAGLCPWDHAAGALLYREAGGVARLLDGRAYEARCRDGRLLAARSERLWQAAAELWAGLERPGGPVG